MEWQALQAVGEIVAAIGVVVSLVYLSTQVRQNTRSIEVASSQDLLTSYLEMIGHAWQTPFGARHYRATLSGSWSDLDVDEQAAGRQLWFAMFRLFEHAHRQHRTGALSDEAWGGWTYQILLTAAMPGFRDMWPGVKLMLNPSFVEWIEGFGDEPFRAAREYRDALAGAGLTVGKILDPDFASESEE